MKRDIERYQQDYIAQHGFEAVLVQYRQRLLIERLQTLWPKVVLEVGCGPNLVYAHYLRMGGDEMAWIIVEPAPAWCASAREKKLPGMLVVEGFMEESVDAVIAALPRAPDLVICAGVLQEVTSANAMLAAIQKTMGKQSVLHINVANAASFHRRLAVSMRLIKTPETFSERNIQGQQHRVYTFNTLTADVESAGFSVMRRGGHFVKPFTHAQMAAIVAALGDAVLDGLYEMGKLDYETACEIYVEARLQESANAARLDDTSLLAGPDLS
jgi:SAM-dependent methyltransferase